MVCLHSILVLLTKLRPRSSRMRLLTGSWGVYERRVFDDSCDEFRRYATFSMHFHAFTEYFPVVPQSGNTLATRGAIICIFFGNALQGEFRA